MTGAFSKRVTLSEAEGSSPTASQILRYAQNDKRREMLAST
jgi:hypothetical protein